MRDLPYDVSFSIDPNTLRDVPNNPNQMREALAVLRAALPAAQGDERIDILGRVGSYARMLGDLSAAQEALERAVALAEQQGDTERQLINQVRLGHVYQWRGNFTLSNTLFEALLAQVKQPPFAHFEAWVCQHAAKNRFDQGEYDEALALFEQALALREEKGDAERIRSTQLGIDACHIRLSAQP